MISLSAALGSTKIKAVKLKPGVYDSVVVSADFAPEYESGKAVMIVYELTSEDGSEYSYKEIFFVNNNDRTMRFEKYLCQNGIDPADIEQFVGCREKLDIRKSTKGRNLMTIDNREFVSKPVVINA